MAERPLRTRQGKIVATLGPGTRSRKVVQMLAEAGVDVFRLNFSHGSHDDHRASLESVRAAEVGAGGPPPRVGGCEGPKKGGGGVGEGGRGVGV